MVSDGLLRSTTESRICGKRRPLCLLVTVMGVIVIVTLAAIGAWATRCKIVKFTYVPWEAPYQCETIYEDDGRCVLYEGDITECYCGCVSYFKFTPNGEWDERVSAGCSTYDD